MTTETAARCPAWCTDHDSFDDGSLNWHKSRDVILPGVVFYASTGTLTGEVKVFISLQPADDGLSLPQVEAVAAALSDIVKAARA